MSYSSIVGVDKAPNQPPGRSSDLLGPSDNSDSGSDARGTEEVHGDSDSTGTGERGVASGMDAPEGGDILPDRIVRLDPDSGAPDTEPDDQEFTDLDDDASAVDDESAP